MLIAKHAIVAFVPVSYAMAAQSAEREISEDKATLETKGRPLNLGDVPVSMRAQHEKLRLLLAFVARAASDSSVCHTWYEPGVRASKVT
jgi:hypothetical protein